MTQRYMCLSDTKLLSFGRSWGAPLRIISRGRWSYDEPARSASLIKDELDIC